MVDLRRILLYHDIDFPSSAKKPDLLQIFRREVAADAPRLKASIAARFEESILASRPVRHQSPHLTRLEASKLPNPARKSTVFQEQESVTPRRRGRLSKPFVDPSADDEMKEPASKSVTPVRNLSVRSRGDRPNPDAVSTPKQEHVDSIDSEEDRTESTKSSPFSSVNFFQSPAPESPPTDRKRPHEADTISSRKKRETILAEKRKPLRPALTPAKKSMPPLTTPNESRSESFETPKHTISETVPQTAPAASRDSRSFKDNTFSNYSTGKPKTSLRGSGAGRRISFMPTVDQLQVSKQFTDQISSSIKFEKQATSSTDTIADNVEEEIKDLEDEMSEEVDEDVTIEEGSSLVPFFQVAGIALVAILISAFARWWVMEKFDAGYCETGFIHWKPHYSHYTPTTLAEYFDKEYLLDRGSQLLDFVRPECQPCPQHAQCYSGFRAECEPGFVKETSFLGRFLPIAPKCRPDTQTKKRVQMLVQKAVSVLRDRNAKSVCGGDVDAEIEEGDLRKILYGLKASTLSDSEFQDLWNSAVKDLENAEEVVVRQVEIVQDRPVESAHGITDSPGEVVKSSVLYQTRLRSTSLASISLGCAIKRSVLLRLNAHRGKISAVILLTLAVFFGKRWLAHHEVRQARAQRLASLAIARLKAQRTAADADESGRTMRVVPVPQLRDEVQADVTSLETRKRVWRDVELLVETNSNVRARQSEVEGEIMRVWEWVGV